MVDGATATPSPSTPTRRSSRRAIDDEAREILAEKPHLVVLAVPGHADRRHLRDYGIADLDFQRVDGGLLVETRDRCGCSARRS